MGRDLLYKPPVPVVPDESEGTSAEKKKKKKGGIRELGRVGADVTRPRAPPAGGSRAYQAAYFTQDVSSVRDVNLGQQSMKALRGEKEATDLRQVVLPPSEEVNSPDADILRGASDLMGLDGSFTPDLPNLLSRQGAWAKQPGMTVEQLEARMRELEALVELRKAALARMVDTQSGGRHPTVVHAVRSAGAGMEAVDDLAQEATALIEATAAPAAGMHGRLAKMLGIKKNT